MRSGPSTTPRRLVAVAGLGAVVLASIAACGGSGTSSSASATAKPTKVIVAHPPGVSGTAIEALLTKFTQQTGIKAEGVPVNGLDLGAKVQLAVKSGRPAWDVAMGITVDIYDVTKKAGAYANIDTSNWAASDLAGLKEANLIGDTYAISQAAAALLVYNNKFASNPPTSWADFFNTTKYPGNRGLASGGTGVPVNLEYAAIASGIDPQKLYPLDVQRALGEVKRLGTNLALWDTAPKGIQDVVSGDTVMTWAFGPSAVSALAKQSVKIAVVPGTAVTKNVAVIFKKAPDGTEAGQAFLKWWYQASVQAEYSKGTGYGIVVPSKPILALIPAKNAAYLPYAGQFAKDYREFNDSYYGMTGKDGKSNLAKVLDAWTAFRSQ